MDRISKHFFTGINYWGSKDAINMWETFDAESIEKDFQILTDYGITHLRVFPLWSVFQPLKALYGPGEVYEFGLGEEPLPDTPAGKAGVSEEACQKFALFCNLAEKYNLKLIVALITGHMSFRTYAPPAFDGKQLLSDPTVMKWQRRFVKYFVGRFRSMSAIVGWDLGNEVNHLPGLNEKSPDSFYIWCATMADAIRSVDTDHPILSGIDNSSIASSSPNLKDAGEIFDIHTTHPYQIFSTNTDPLCSMKPICDLPFRCQISQDISGIPTFIQEFGSIGYANCSQKTEADFYRASLLTSLAHGFHGTMWWCAFDQGEFDYAPYRWNTIGSDYGFFDRNRTPKPVAEMNRTFQMLLNKLTDNGTLPPHQTDACVIVPQETPDSAGQLNSIMRATYILAKQANIDVRFSYALDPIPDAKLYILTGLTHHKTISKQRLDELLEKVNAGATLYLSLDSGLFRQLPAITGVEVAYREQIEKVVTIQWHGHKLPINTQYFYHPESSRANDLAVCDTGETVFFKYPFGRGYVYLLTLPLERYLAETPCVFHKEDTPPYHLIYRELSKTAGIQRLCDSDHPHIRLTEHRIDETHSYIFAINYSGKPACANLTLAEGWHISDTVYGNQANNGKLCLSENNGTLLIIEKDNN